MESINNLVNQIQKIDRNSLAIGAAVAVSAVGAKYLASNALVNIPPRGVAKYSIKFDTDKSYGGLLFAEVFKNQGVKVVFTLVGGHVSPILVGCKEMGISVVDVRHEVNAAFAADAVSRLTGVPGVAIVTAGPGVANTVTAIKNAQVAQSPLILIGGATSDLVKGMGSLQDIDQISMIKPHVKWYSHIATVKDIVPVLEKAFWISQSGTPGPVFIEAPIDVLYQEKIAREVYGSKKVTSPSLFDKIANWYMTYHLNNIYSSVNEVTFHSPLRLNISIPSANQVYGAISLLRKAKKPFLMIGSQVLLQTEKAQSGAITKAVNKIRIPTGLSGMARGLLGKSSLIQIKQKLARRTALKECDLVIVVGLPLDFRMDYGRSINGRSKIIKVNRDKHDLYLNNMLRPATLAIQADGATFLEQLSDAIGSLPESWYEWLLQIQKIEQEQENSIKVIKPTEEQKQVNPIYLCQEIEKAADDNAIFVADGGDFVGTAAYILRPRSPLSWLDPGPFGTLGVGSGFALAAKVARPDQEVWIIFGDGAVGFSIAEFDTMVRHKIPLIAVVGNDGAWMQILREQSKILHSDVACVLEQVNYQDTVRSFGAEGILVKEESEVAAALQKAKQIVREQKVPVLVNVLIAKSDFREGSLSM